MHNRRTGYWENMRTGLHAEQENRISGEQDIRRTCEQEKMQNRTIRRTGKGGRTVKKDNKENKKGLRQSCC